MPSLRTLAELTRQALAKPAQLTLVDCALALALVATLGASLFGPLGTSVEAKFQLIARAL